MTTEETITPVYIKSGEYIAADSVVDPAYSSILGIKLFDHDTREIGGIVPLSARYLWSWYTASADAHRWVYKGFNRLSEFSFRNSLYGLWKSPT